MGPNKLSRLSPEERQVLAGAAEAAARLLTRAGWPTSPDTVHAAILDEEIDIAFPRATFHQLAAGDADEDDGPQRVPHAISQKGHISFAMLMLTLVNRCNYRCASCLVGEKLSSRESLSYHDAVRLIDEAVRMGTIRRVGFVGGEPFLVYNLLVDIADYTWKSHRLPIMVATNGYWATGTDRAVAHLEPLSASGMTELLLSWDDFHAEFGTLAQIAHAIEACNALGVRPTVQNIVVKGATRLPAIQSELAALCNTENVRWNENPCVPTGLGADTPVDRQMLFPVDELPYGRCTAGTACDIQPNGDVTGCSGVGVMSDGLTLGNVKDQSLEEIIEAGSANPLINSLVAYCGPKDLIERLRRIGRSDLVPERVTDACDACARLMNSDEAVAVLRAHLAEAPLKPLLDRLACETYL